MESAMLHRAASRVLLAGVVAGLCFCLAFPAFAEDAAPLFDNLGTSHRKVTTTSKEAQRYVDQGLVLYSGFNHEEAIRSFEAAANLDPACAMAYWGIALSAGPNINNPFMDEAAVALAWDNVNRAVTQAKAGTVTERALIHALSARYLESPPEDRSDLNLAYADAMREVWRAHPDDADVGAWFAEALMNLRPWDQWTHDGEMQPGTDEVLATLHRVLEISPNHVLANHLNIHAWEASPMPAKAADSANRLRTLVPGAGHLVHMPGHIDIRLGRYADAITANQHGIAMDLAYVDRVGRVPGFYTIYRAHNYHFLAYAAMFDGRRDLAMQAARDLVAELPMELVRAFPDFLDAFLAVPIHVMVRFGLWNEILAEPAPPADLEVSTAFWHYGRTVALSVLGRTEEATTEMEHLNAACDAVPESRLIGNNPALVVLDIGRPMAEGELEYRRGNYDRAFELLRESVRRDDELRYDEPWGWMQPARHSLGALLTEQKKYAEAEAVYREDLRIHPDNGWSLHGLAECLRETGRTKEADVVTARYRDSWAHADVAIRGSCYCRTKG